MSVSLTDEQREAVENTGGALLVSAAAGSGKTRVLVERLMRKIDEGSDVDDFLIITYTNAAAAELRGKILDALYDRIAQNPGSTRLHRQASLCGRAHIETIHSFCLGLIREHAGVLGLSPDLRVADETECRFLKRDVLETLLEELYDRGEEDFRRLADTMGAGRDDSALIDVLLDTHTKLLSHPDPADWVRRQLEALDLDGTEDVSQTVWGTILMERADRTAAYWEERLTGLLTEADEAFLKAYGESLSATLDDLGRFREALTRSWDEAGAVEVRFPRAKSVPGFEDEKQLRTQCKKELEKLRETFSDSSRKLLEDMRLTAPVVRAALETVLLFEERYGAAKRRRGLLDFSDQEHLALKLLTDPSAGGEELCRETAERFTEIMIDEYQDVNTIQEAIFTAVSREGRNVFMVGDVKQSIYRFRLADPTIFLGKYNAFRDASEASEGEPRKVVLSRNFRSRREILEAANFVFQNVMSARFGDVDYGPREFLYPGADFPASPEAPVELDVIDAAAGDEDDGAEKTDFEARFAAGRILELVRTGRVSDGAGGLRPVRFGDIAVLMRSPRSRQARWTEIFAEYGVPLAMDAPGDFFNELEVSLTVSLLSVIDNPRQDIPLAAVLQSPLYGFTAEELGKIRLCGKSGDFYTALLAAGERDEKCARFLKELRDFRLAAPDLSASELLWHVYNRTRLLALVSAMPGASGRRRNLMALFEYARQFERAGYKGLFGFLTSLRRAQEEGSGPETASQGTEDAVRLMSIHKSKGLEFPIVILADTTKRFNTDDTKKPLLIHPELGVGPRRVDLARRIEYPTLARLAVRERLSQESLSEEVRVLYVAMTRARDKLVMLASFGNAERELQRLTNVPLPASPELLRSARSSADWLLIPALRRPESGPIRFGRPNVPVEGGEAWDVRLVQSVPAAPDRAAPAGEERENADPEEVRRLTETLQYRYPYGEAATLSSKLTATELKGTYRTEEAAEDAESLTEPPLTPPMRPAFMEGRRGLTAAQKGTAAHIVMQYADYTHCLTVEGVRGEIERLRKLRTLTDEEAAAVRPSMIADFFRSEPGQRILNAERLWRELKFSLLVDSEELSEVRGEKVLLQGVVDCCALREGKLTVIDFKTDYVTEETADGRALYYRGQLDAYARAMERILGLPVEERLVCFLTAGITRSV